MTEGIPFSPELVQQILENGGDISILDGKGFNIILNVAHNDGNYPNLALLNSLVERDDIPREDKIDALEMAGAVILHLRGYFEEEVEIALNYWRRALTLRLMNTEDCRPICKTPLKLKSGSLTEWSSLDDLLRIIQMEPSELEMQSLLVRLRIFSSLGWRVIRQLFWPSIEVLLARVLQGQLSLSHFLDFTWVLCDTVLHSERPQERDLFYSILRMVRVFIVGLNGSPVENLILNSDIFKKITEIVSLVVDPSNLTNGSNNLEDESIDETVKLCADMISLMSRHPELVTEEILPSLVQLVGRDGIRDSSGFNVLHLICIDLNPDTSSTIRLLHQLGVDLNARNGVGWGALHILATKENGELRDAAARLLLELRVHLDLATDIGLTATNIWLMLNNQQRHLLPDWLQEGVPKLMCLSSRVIRRKKLPYKENNALPAVLVPYVSLH